MSEWLEHVREKYQQIYNYGSYQWVKGVGVGMTSTSALMLAYNTLADNYTGKASEFALPVSGLLVGLVIYVMGRVIETPSGRVEDQLLANMKQVTLERKKAELDKGKTAAIASLDEKIAAIEKLRASNN